MKLIKLSSDHYIIVDDSEIKIDDYFYNGKAVAKMCNQWMITFTAMDAIKCKKITHSTEPIEHSYNSTSNGFNMRQMSSDVELVYDEIQPLSLSEVKELIGEVDEVLQNSKTYVLSKFKSDTDLEQLNCYKHIETYIKGYNQALEDNKDRKYTEKDVIAIVEKSRATGLTAEYILQYLQSPTSWDVEFVDGKLKLK